MSALPIIHEPSASARPETTVTAPRPRLIAEPRKTAAKRKGVSPLPRIAVKCVGFVALATFTCYSSTLIGQVLVEQTRREELHAEARTRQTQQIEVALRERIEALKNAQTVSDWAWDHEFSGPGLGAPIQSKTQSSTAKGKAVGVPKRSPVTTPESAPVTVHVRVAVASPPREPASFLPTHSRNQRYGRILAMNRD